MARPFAGRSVGAFVRPIFASTPALAPHSTPVPQLQAGFASRWRAPFSQMPPGGADPAGSKQDSVAVDAREPPASRGSNGGISSNMSSMKVLTGLLDPNANRIQTETRRNDRILDSISGGDDVSPHEDLISTPEPVETEPYHFHIYSHKHNTHVTVTKPNCDPIVSMSCGNLSFKSSQRKHYDSAYQVGAAVIDKLQQEGWHRKINAMEVNLRGFGTGREAVTKVLLGNEGRLLRAKIARVVDSTRLKFGGSRSRKPRRLG